ELLRRRAEVDCHPLARLGRLRLDLRRNGSEIFRSLHEGPDFGVYLRVGGVLGPERVGAAAELGTCRFSEAPQTGAVRPAIREHRQTGNDQQNRREMTVSHVGKQRVSGNLGWRQPRKAREIRLDFWHGAWVFDIAHRVSLADPSAHLLEVTTTVRLA